MENSVQTQLYDLLVTHNFDPEILDSMGKPVDDPAQAEMFSFDWTHQDRNYGTVVVLVSPGNSLEIYFGDSLGRGMEQDDRRAWYRFVEDLKMLAVKNMLKDFKVENLNRLKYTMRGMAAIKEGLFEGYYGSRRVSYSDQPRQTRLVIKHNKSLAEGEPRYRNIDSLFVETDAGERFRLPFTKLLGGRAMARHVSEGGTPYDAFGQHISQCVKEMSTLSKFVRAARTRQFDQEAQAMVETGIRHYGALKNKIRRMVGHNGYREEVQAFRPDHFSDSEVTVEAIRDMFVEQNLDERIEAALPVLARLAQEETSMKEADQFESWANRLAEGTWSVPDTPEKISKLRDFMSQEQPVGPDAANATEQLYDIIGDDKLFDALADLASGDPDSDARIVVKQWIQDNQFEPELQDMLRPIAVEFDVDDQEQNVDIDLEQDDVREATRQIKGPHGDLEITDTPSGTTVRRVKYKGDDSAIGASPLAYPPEGMPASVPGHRGYRAPLDSPDTNENIDTDGVMMTRTSNMSSESRGFSGDLARLLELAKK